jgi:hypothetical protein
VILAHQLIAAKLNIANGADPTGRVPPRSRRATRRSARWSSRRWARLPAPASVSATATTLDQLQQRPHRAGHCAEVPAKPATWGSIKSTYRR